MTNVNDDLIRTFLADEGRRAVAAAPSLDEVAGRLAPRVGGRPSGASQRLIVLLAATLLLVAALGTAIAVGSGILRLPLVTEDPTSSEAMWPQSSLEEVREAQERADAGDSRYTWQLFEPELGFPNQDTEIVARFLRDVLGWEEFRYRINPADSFSSGAIYDNTYIRCAPGETNPLYPNDPVGQGCAPTTDEGYERVSLDLAQPVRQGSSGIWVVTRWAMIEPLEMVVPPSEAETTAFLEAFLGARIEGEGAEEYVDVVGASDAEAPSDEVPLLYATTTGAPYERSEFEVVEGPVWPDGWMRVEVRLFAEDGEAVVEQLFLMSRYATDRLRLQYEYYPLEFAPTTENGQAVPVQYDFLDGGVTFHAAWPWLVFPDEPQGPTITTLTTYNNADLYDARLAVVADPRPIESGCQEGPAPADAAALARSIRSDRDLETTAPAKVSVGGIDALRMDVTAAPGAIICNWSPLVVTGSFVDREHRMRLYLLDIPGGSSRVLAIAFTVPKPNFERVIEEGAAPIVDSFEFHTP
jgi:hypothetical protein